MRRSRDCHWEASCGGAEGVKLLAGPQPCAGATSQLYGGTSPSPEMTRPVPQGSQWTPSGAPWPHALPLLSIRGVCVRKSSTRRGAAVAMGWGPRVHQRGCVEGRCVRSWPRLMVGGGAETWIRVSSMLRLSLLQHRSRPSCLLLTKLPPSRSEACPILGQSSASPRLRCPLDISSGMANAPNSTHVKSHL